MPRNIRIAQVSWKRLIGSSPGKPSSLTVLHVALAPAQVAPREFEHGRRILLPAPAFLRQHAHLVAGAAHQRRFDLIMGQDVSAQRRLPGRIGRWQCSAKGAIRTIALWPQNGPQSPAHHALPMV